MNQPQSGSLESTAEISVRQTKPAADGWVLVDERIDMEREDTVCMDSGDVERYGIPVLVFDEDSAARCIATYDFRDKVWQDWSSGVTLNGVTHWRLLPDEPQDLFQEAVGQ